MPELPEVESQARDLRRLIVGATITDAWVGWNKTIATPSVAAFKKKLVGKKIKRVARRAKFILIELSGDMSLVSHFRMTGHFRVVSKKDTIAAKHWYHFADDPFTRVAFKLKDGRVLHFSDIRKFGRLWLVATDDVEQLDELKDLGPEPLSPSFTPDVFIDCMRRFSGMIKPVLLNQACVAGIGNIYADESLFDAGLHPKTRVKNISDKKLQELYAAVRANLAAGVKHRGSSVGEYVNMRGDAGEHGSFLRVYQQAGKPCQRRRNGKKCSGTVKRIVVAQRGTHICPACQPAPRS